MSDDKSGGLLSGLLVGAGLPDGLLAGNGAVAHCLVRRVPLAALCAVSTTVLAVFSPELVAMAKEMDSCCGPSLVTPGVQAIFAMDKIGWWTLAGITWATLFALILLSVFLQAPVAGNDEEPNQTIGAACAEQAWMPPQPVFRKAYPWRRVGHPATVRQANSLCGIATTQPQQNCGRYGRRLGAAPWVQLEWRHEWT